jgi:5-methylcytosine-specific restriction protein A
MPTVFRLCGKCKITRISRGRYCPRCQRAHDAARGTTTARGLGWAFQKKRRYILQRDGWVCGICHRIGAATVDHIVPRARGGSADDENLRAAHKRCNEARGARPNG